MVRNSVASKNVATRATKTLTPTLLLASGLKEIPSEALFRCSLTVRTATRNEHQANVAQNAAIAKQMYFPG
jgi:hypothetical protein